MIILKKIIQTFNYIFYIIYKIKIFGVVAQSVRAADLTVIN